MAGLSDEGTPEELRELFDQSPTPTDITDPGAFSLRDIVLPPEAHGSASEYEDDAAGEEFTDTVRELASSLEGMSQDEVDRFVEQQRERPSLLRHLSSVIPRMLEDGKVSPVPYGISAHGGVTPHGLTQEEWEALPDSTQQLLIDNPVRRSND